MTGNKRSIRMGRRDFLNWCTRVAGGLIVMPLIQACQKLGVIEATESPENSPVPTIELSRTPSPRATISTASPQAGPDGNSRIAFVRTRDRQEGVRRALSLLGENSIKGKNVILKPNFNSSDPAPASTHPDTLRAMVRSLQEMGVEAITVADRSGMGNTREVMNKLGVIDLAGELGFEILAIDELTEDENWVLIKNENSHWKNGFPIPSQLLEAQAIVQTCCLKPHRFGGHFTMSLKNSVGMVAKFMGRGEYNYMSELHSSPYQRLMIAEINTTYVPALVVLDGVEAFIDNGPESGTRVWGDVILAGTDRVAIDAVGLALLRFLGYKGVAARGSIFRQEQIARAVELGLGIDGPDKIDFITDDPDSASYAAQIHDQMQLSG